MSAPEIATQCGIYLVRAIDRCLQEKPTVTIFASGQEETNELFHYADVHPPCGTQLEDWSWRIQPARMLRCSPHLPPPCIRAAAVRPLVRGALRCGAAFPALDTCDQRRILAARSADPSFSVHWQEVTLECPVSDFASNVNALDSRFPVMEST